MADAETSIDISRIDRGLTDLVPLYFARTHCLLPIYSSGNQVVVVTADGTDDPFELGRLSDKINLRLVPFLLRTYPRPAVESAIELLYKGKRLRFGELLLVNKVIDDAKLSEVLSLQKNEKGKRVGDIVRELGYAEEAQLQQIYAEQLGYRFMDIDTANFLDLTLIDRFPEDLIRKHRILPMPSGDNYESILLLTANELEPELLQEVKTRLRLEKVEPVLTVQEELDVAIDSAFRRIAALHSREKSIGAMLLEKHLLTQEQLDKALAEQRENNLKLGELLIEKRILPERVVMEVISEKIGAHYERELPMVIEPILRTFFTAKFAAFNKVVPIGMEGERLKIAMTDPADRNLVGTLKAATKRDIIPILASDRQIMAAIQRLYQDNSKGDGPVRLDLKRKIELVNEDPGLQYNTERIINTVNSILIEAVLQGASDVHLTPEENGVTLFYRIDGGLKRVAMLPVRDRDNIAARIKIMSEMRIDARHIPQSGRIVATIEGRHIDFRVSTLPMQFGENIVLRILDSSKMSGGDLRKIGMPTAVYDEFIEQCERAQGIVLVTGPTGSGKTTSLYHVLQYLHENFPQKSISTIENPIEYVVAGIVQSEVNEGRGLTYAKILKEKLRQDPDIIMVGEIRNLEEGELAFTAGLTGHLVFSTLHTNDGATTVRRLVDMGLEPYSVSTGINCILSQRLAKRICEHCKTDYLPTDREVSRVRKTYPDFDPMKHHLKKGWGCDFCNDGYRGRVGIYELLTIDSEIKRLIASNATDSEIRSSAVRKGMKTLRMAGLDVAFQGVTTLQEVLSVTDVMS